MEKLDVARMMLRVEFVAQRMADDHRSARFHQRLVAIHAEQVAEPSALHQYRIHDRVDVVWTDVRHPDDQDVRLAFDWHRILLEDARQRLPMHGFRLARPYPSHPIRRGVLM